MLRRLHFSKILCSVEAYYKIKHKLVDAHDNYHFEAREKIKSDELPVLMLNV
jgi:hypothetical protein